MSLSGVFQEQPEDFTAAMDTTSPSLVNPLRSAWLLGNLSSGGKAPVGSVGGENSYHFLPCHLMDFFSMSFSLLLLLPHDHFQWGFPQDSGILRPTIIRVSETDHYF